MSSATGTERLLTRFLGVDFISVGNVGDSALGASEGGDGARALGGVDFIKGIILVRANFVRGAVSRNILIGYVFDVFYRRAAQ